MTYPDFSFENPHWNNDKLVIGIDEVGRGAFAGPLYVGAVIFPNNMHKDLVEEIIRNRINDSKLLSIKRREALAEFIKKTALSYHIASISVEDINKIGVGRAGKQGMEYVARKLKAKLDSETSSFHVLTDAFEIDQNEFPDQTPIIRGDSLSISIAAASIIAKVARDRHMEELASDYPRYEWNKNKGYGTRAHREALTKYGSTSHHRHDFIRNYISA